MKKYPATFFLLLTSIVVQFILSRHPSLMAYFAFNPSLGVLSILGLITHMVSHGSWGHLIGNFTFGLPFLLFLEHRLGKEKTLEFYFFSGVAAALLELLLAGGGMMIGSSGALFGVFAGACLAFGETTEEHLLAVGVFLALFIQQLAYAPLGALFGIAFYAHVGGALGGLLLSHRLYSSAPKE
jgi:membrane associated rhomboid family serine protease